MSIAAAGKMTSTSPGAYFKPSVVVQPNGLVDVAFGKTNVNSSPPWPVTLYSEQLGANGAILQKPSVIAKYTEPGTDSNSGAIFDFYYESVEMSNSSRAVLWTQPVGTYAPNDQTEVEMQLLTNSGAKASPKPITLAIDGKSGQVTDLYDLGMGALTGFGKNFMVCYSTFDPASGKSQISYEEFSDSGKALKHGVIESIADGTHHGLVFASYFIAGNSSKRCYLEMNRAKASESTIEVRTLNANGAAGPFHLNVHLKGPQGQSASVIDGFTFVRPGDSKTPDNYGVITETFQYNNKADYAIAIQTISATGKITHSTIFQVPQGFTSLATESARICHVGNGDIVVGYNDGSQSLLQEYDSNLKALGAAIALPNSSGDLTNLVSLRGDKFEAFWRQDAAQMTHEVLHSQVFTAS